MSWTRSLKNESVTSTTPVAIQAVLRIHSSQVSFMRQRFAVISCPVPRRQTCSICSMKQDSSA